MPKTNERRAFLPETEGLLAVRELTRAYPQGFCLGPVTFHLEAGETVAMIGANGAGKSTLFDLLSGNADATSGEVYLHKQRLTPETFMLKRAIGYLPQHIRLPRWVTGAEVLRYAANLYELHDAQGRIEAVMNYWDCASYGKKPLAACSHGMQKRLGLALASLHEPSLLILDEPFSGLDLYHTRALEEEIKRRQGQGLTTVLSTHIFPYVAKLCERVFILKAGELSPLAEWHELAFAERIRLVESSFFPNSR